MKVECRASRFVIIDALSCVAHRRSVNCVMPMRFRRFCQCVTSSLDDSAPDLTILFESSQWEGGEVRVGVRPPLPHRPTRVRPCPPPLTSRRGSAGLHEGEEHEGGVETSSDAMRVWIANLLARPYA